MIDLKEANHSTKRLKVYYLEQNSHANRYIRGLYNFQWLSYNEAFAFLCNKTKTILEF